MMRSRIIDPLNPLDDKKSRSVQDPVKPPHLLSLNSLKTLAHLLINQLECHPVLHPLSSPLLLRGSLMISSLSAPPPPPPPPPVIIIIHCVVYDKSIGIDCCVFRPKCLAFSARGFGLHTTNIINIKLASARLYSKQSGGWATECTFD